MDNDLNHVEKKRVPSTVWSDPMQFLAFGFGSGCSPKMPGTMGTLAAVPLVIILQHCGFIWYTVAMLIAIAVGGKICDAGCKAMGEHDHPAIVWDEIAGFLLTMWLAPVGFWWIVVGFCWFRLFDIWKPWPIRMMDEAWKGGWGVMADDLLAAVYAIIALQICVLLWHWIV